jgi:hypothetical protein
MFFLYIKDLRLIFRFLCVNSNLEQKCGFIRKLTASDDMNDIVQNGFYFYMTEDVPENAPYQNASVVEVYGSNSDTTQKIQRVTRYGAAGHTAFRPLLGSAGWLDWNFCAVKSDLLGFGALVKDGDFNDIVKSGVYYVANAVTNKPTSIGGLYILGSPYNNATTYTGLYITNAVDGGVYKITCSSSKATVTKIV